MMFKWLPPFVFGFSAIVFLQSGGSARGVGFNNKPPTALARSSSQTKKDARRLGWHSTQEQVFSALSNPSEKLPSSIIGSVLSSELVLSERLAHSLLLTALVAAIVNVSVLIKRGHSTHMSDLIFHAQFIIITGQCISLPFHRSLPILLRSFGILGPLALAAWLAQRQHDTDKYNGMIDHLSLVATSSMLCLLVDVSVFG